jgi:carbon-monoxide dehydrogenase medium subunit
MPMIALLLDAEVHAHSAARGARVISARDFFRGSLMTSLETDEIVTEITLDLPEPGEGWAFGEFARRHGDLALAAIAATVRRSNGVTANARLGIMGVGDKPLRLAEVERFLEGKALSGPVIDRAIEVMQSEISPQSDLNGSSDYRRHLAGALARRALAEAWQRAVREKTQ